MIVMRHITLEDAEAQCFDVRSGDVEAIKELSRPFLERNRSLIPFLRKDRSKEVPTVDLLASFEALQARGKYWQSTDAVEELLKRPMVERELRRCALARAGKIAILKGLPLDLGPIISEIGLSRKDLASALEHYRKRREKKDHIVEMESNLLQAMLLDQRADHVESPSLSDSYLRGAMDGFDRANSIGAQIKGDNRGYHLTKCMFNTAEFLLKRGDHERGAEGMDACIRRCRRAYHKPLLLESLLAKGEYVDDGEEALDVLKEAVEVARNLSNQWEEARGLYLMGVRECADAPDRKISETGVNRMIQAAGLAEKAGDGGGAILYRLEAALWSNRGDRPERGLEEGRKAYRSLKPGTDPEMEIRALTMILYSHLEEDHRRKAKVLLLDLIMNYPVKQYPATFGILKEAISGAEWLRKDKDTKELFEDEIIYRIDLDAVDEIIQRAKQAYPNEFGAMLRGIEHITHIDPVMEGAGNRNSFLFSLYSRFSQRNVDGEGVVHSHPSGSARPSRADLSMFGRFPGINIIIGYPYTKDSMAAYDRLGNRVDLEIIGKRKE
ncbi:MAG: Mov34/MPN/PAD-1 family protein [Candidatus Thermoplasmatota archaeon]|nr:Mov34/MPN/PAD-1 family protein [Candidatus Thermoplasmatota archaeon]